MELNMEFHSLLHVELQMEFDLQLNLELHMELHRGWWKLKLAHMSGTEGIDVFPPLRQGILRLPVLFRH